MSSKFYQGIQWYVGHHCWNFGKISESYHVLEVICPTTTNLYTHLNNIYLTYNYSGTLDFIAVELMFTTNHLYVSPNVSTVHCVEGFVAVNVGLQLPVASGSLTEGPIPPNHDQFRPKYVRLGPLSGR